MNDDGSRIEARLVALEVRTEERHAALVTSMIKADEVLKIHLEALNGVAAQIREERGRYVHLSWFNAKHEEVMRRLAQHDRLIWLAIGGALVLGFAIRLLVFRGL